MRLEITADGKLQQPQANLRLQGSGLAYGAITAERLTTSIDVVAHQPLRYGPARPAAVRQRRHRGPPRPRGRAPAAGGLDWQIDVFAREEDAIDLNLVRLSSPDLAVEVRGEVDPQTLAAAGQVDLTVASLARLAAPLGQPVDGALRSMPTWWPPSRPGRSMPGCRARSTG